MSIERLQTVVAEQGRALSATLQSSEITSDTKLRVDGLLEAARELTVLQQGAAEAAVPELAEYIRDKRADFEVAEFEKAPVVLYGTAQEQDVLERWREQLKANARGLAGVISGEREFNAEWLYWYDHDGPRKAGLPFFRAEQIRDCLKEIRKLLVLLTLPRKIIRAEPAGTLGLDDFSSGMGQWKRYGSGEVSIDGGKMNVSGEGVTAWWEHEFADTVIRFEFQPVYAANDASGALFAFPAVPRPGKGYDASAGDMVNYNLGIDTYHVSLYRGATKRTNLRRAGRGLKMLSTIQPDPCGTLRKTYRVEIVKLGPSMQVFVDLRLVHSYVDAGVYGPPPAKGRFGIRHFAGGRLDAYYSNFAAASLGAEN
ncbi:MAG TPA: DUF1961 family protein [Planctomycetota bacterium]|nr:DUF1961 family protein [Planctomycetota bacterium]